MILPRQTNLVAFNARNQTSINVVALASTLTAVRLGQLDTTAFDLIETVPTWTPSAPITSMCSVISA
jgi:hypothetical protein